MTTDNYHKRVATVRQKIAGRPEYNPLVADAFLSGVPKGDFAWRAEYADEWHVYPDYCGEGVWHRVTYCWDLERTGGVLSATAWAVDEYGNWDVMDEWTEGGDRPWAEFYRYIVTQDQDYWVQWADYWLWAAEARVDPLDEAPEGMNPEDPWWVDWCVTQAENMVRWW